MVEEFENGGNGGGDIDRRGEEIWEEMEGKVDVLMGGVGRGGRLRGVGEGLKEDNGEIEIMGVEGD